MAVFFKGLCKDENFYSKAYISLIIQKPLHLMHILCYYYMPVWRGQKLWSEANKCFQSVLIITSIFAPTRSPTSPTVPHSQQRYSTVRTPLQDNAPTDPWPQCERANLPFHRRSHDQTPSWTPTDLQLGTGLQDQAVAKGEGLLPYSNRRLLLHPTELV